MHSGYLIRISNNCGYYQVLRKGLEKHFWIDFVSFLLHFDISGKSMGPALIAPTLMKTLKFRSKSNSNKHCMWLETTTTKKLISYLDMQDLDLEKEDEEAMWLSKNRKFIFWTDVVACTLNHYMLALRSPICIPFPPQLLVILLYFSDHHTQCKILWISIVITFDPFQKKSWNEL